MCLKEESLEQDDKESTADISELGDNVMSPPPSKIVEDDRPAGGGKKKTKSKDEKTCRVCGDRALGCNFDAISCESCKAFFRRNALKEKVKHSLFAT